MDEDGVRLRDQEHEMSLMSILGHRTGRFIDKGLVSKENEASKLSKIEIKNINGRPPETKKHQGAAEINIGRSEQTFNILYIEGPRDGKFGHKLIRN